VPVIGIGSGPLIAGCPPKGGRYRSLTRIPALPFAHSDPLRSCAKLRLFRKTSHPGVSGAAAGPPQWGETCGDGDVTLPGSAIRFCLRNLSSTRSPRAVTTTGFATSARALASRTRSCQSQGIGSGYGIFCVPDTGDFVKLDATGFGIATDMVTSPRGGFTPYLTLTSLSHQAYNLLPAPRDRL
jgi:hypothetical protein